MDNGLNLAYENLAIAVVEQAIKDLRSYPKEVEHFFLNENSIFSMCMPHCDGKAILKRIKENNFIMKGETNEGVQFKGVQEDSGV